MLGLHLDRQRGGTHYSDRMHRILGVCHACGVLWHEEKVSYGKGMTETHRLEDVRPYVPQSGPHRGKPMVLVTPQYEKYGLSVNPRVLPRLRSMGPQFAYALNVPSVAVEVDGDVVWVRVPRECSVADGVVLFQQAWALAPDIQPGSVLLGVDEEQKQLLLDLESPSNAHCAVIGMTGSGKSTLMKTMILSAEMTGGARVALFDPSGGFQPLSGHPAVWRGGLFRRAEDCELGLSLLAHSLDRENRDEHDFTCVFVDEVPELVHQRPKIKEHLGRLAQAGRHAGLHLILGAQHPLAGELGQATLRNIPVRLIGRVADPTAAYNAAGRNDSGAESLRGGGDFVAINGALKRHFQAAMPSPELLEQWAQRYPPRPPRLPPRPILAGVSSHLSSQPVALAQGGVRAPADHAPSPVPASGSGRPYDDIDPDLVAWVKEFHAANQRLSPARLRPSNNEIAAEAKARGLGEWGRDKTRSARALALGEAAEPADHAVLKRRQEALHAASR